MIITKTTPFTKPEIEKLRERYDIYIKTVIDIDQKVCSAGSEMHFDCEQILLERGSKQHALWGGGIDLDTNELDCVSFINIRPKDGNRSKEIESEKIRESFYNLMKYFFREVYEY
jgi:hypothetical protein